MQVEVNMRCDEVRNGGRGSFVVKTIRQPATEAARKDLEERGWQCWGMIQRERGTRQYLALLTRNLYGKVIADVCQ